MKSDLSMYGNVEVVSELASESELSGDVCVHHQRAVRLKVVDDWVYTAKLLGNTLPSKHDCSLVVEPRTNLCVLHAEFASIIYFFKMYSPSEQCLRSQECVLRRQCGAQHSVSWKMVIVLNVWIRELLCAVIQFLWAQETGTVNSYKEIVVVYGADVMSVQ